MKIQTIEIGVNYNFTTGLYFKRRRNHLLQTFWKSN
jgi:hypothetical protein